ncbi:mitochondrial import inner membrane translocase subunit Tim8 A-like [Nomia melanderi]|uniref:mitochondrial import inner membrane translocase subunit Tim8 A-like n=1 Tax=Nomia melanderi TaxID=2448451 RepID=UPI00130445E2|nr:mitochondrial import inner membrane translocase subunit Tim8 A-like [Nomia melanderi]XP_031836158.1 mitochondrial import inner membrane translocase subunit Tim8 A-like [Nomia melanderi]
MSFMEEQRSQGAVDERFQAFIETEAKKQQFQELVYNLTDICWDICVDEPSPRLSAKIEKCLVNCVERFIDTTNFITNRLERVVVNSSSELDME